MFSKTDRLKIIDFGLSTNKEEKKMCGTVGYMAPEILENQKCSLKSDIFSAGCIFYEL